MKRNKKWWIVAAVLLLIAAVAFFALRWAWKYYGLPERPDRTEYKTIEERAEKALAFAQRHNMSERYALFVDYGIPSGTPRLFLWDFRRKRKYGEKSSFQQSPRQRMLIFGTISRHERAWAQDKTQFSPQGDGHRQSVGFQKRTDDSQRALGASMVLERLYPSQSSLLSGVRDDLPPRHGLFVATDQSRAKTAAFVEF